MTQHLRQLGHAELAGSTRAVGERGETDLGLLVAGPFGHGYLPCVTPEIIEILTALMLGFLHALEVDHMLAVTTFVAGRPALSTAARFGFRWGVGHSLAVLALGGVLLLTGVRWPQRFDAIGEGLVGLMLMGLGLWALRSSGKLHLHEPSEHGDHAHLHLHGGASAHGHEHEQPHAHPHAHGPSHTEHQHHDGHGITLVGLMHGLAGSSAVVALVPVTLIQRTDVGLAYLAAFGVGVTAGMMVYATVAAYAMRQAAARSLLWGQWITALVGGAGVVVGALWVWRAVGR
jgi:ABC-type nickel/cobalt efflux system permease component RcnA